MKHLVRTLAALVTALAPQIAAAGGDILIEGAWSRASIGAARPGVAYMTIRNAGERPVTLTGLRSDIATIPQIHRTATNAEGISTMTPSGKLTIAPGKSIALEPGGLHVMLMQLTEPLVKGESFPLIFVFEDGTEIRAVVPILGVAARGPGG